MSWLIILTNILVSVLICLPEINYNIIPYNLSLLSRVITKQDQSEFLNRLKLYKKDILFYALDKQGEGRLSKYCFFANLDGIEVLLGNYLCHFAQGLVISYPIHFSKKKNPIINSSQDNIFVIKPDARTYYGDNPYFFGIAIKKELFTHLKASLFFSDNKIDASLNKDKTARKVYLYTDNEKYKDTLRERLYGFRLLLNLFEKVDIGSSYYQARYTPRLNPPESSYRLRGDKNTVLGLDFEFRDKYLKLVGEIAKDKDIAWILNILPHLNEKIKILLSYRSWGKKFCNIHAFSHSIQPFKSISNEKGRYIAFEYLPSDNLSIKGYHETAKKDITQDEYKLSKLKDTGIGLDYKLKNNSIRSFIIYQDRLTQVKLTTENKRIYAPIKRVIINFQPIFYLSDRLRLNFDCEYLSQWVLNRVEGGIVSSTRLSYLTKKLKFKIGYTTSAITRCKDVNTYPFNPRLSSYEDEVFGGFVNTHQKSHKNFYFLVDTTHPQKPQFRLSCKYKYLFPKYLFSSQLIINF